MFISLIEFSLLFIMLFISYILYSHRNDEMLCGVCKKIDDGLDNILYCDESLDNHKSLLDCINLENHPFKIKKGINKRVRKLDVVVYFEFLIDDETELPIVIIGTKFLDENNEVLFDLIIDKYGDSCIVSKISNERRRSKINLAIAFAEYYLINDERLGGNIKINKTIRTALDIPGLDKIRDYNLEFI